MAALEDAGLISRPHISAGGVPSDERTGTASSSSWNPLRCPWSSSGPCGCEWARWRGTRKPGQGRRSRSFPTWRELAVVTMPLSPGVAGTAPGVGLPGRAPRPPDRGPPRSSSAQGIGPPAAAGQPGGPGQYGQQAERPLRWRVPQRDPEQAGRAGVRGKPAPERGPARPGGGGSGRWPRTISRRGSDTCWPSRSSIPCSRARVLVEALEERRLVQAVLREPRSRRDPGGHRPREP